MEEGPVVLELESTPRSIGLTVQVQDTKGAPVAGARLSAVLLTSDGVVHGHGEVPPRSGVTDENGTFTFVGKAIFAGSVAATAPDGRFGITSTRQLDRYARVVVDRAGSLRGRLHGASEAELEGARVHLSGALGSYAPAVGQTWTAEVAGSSFTLEGLPAGKLGLILESSGPRLVVGPFDGLPNSAEVKRVEIKAGTVTEVDLEVTAGGTLMGVVSSEGRPVARARVRAVLAPRTSSFPAGFVLHGAHVWRLDGPFENAPTDPQSHRVVETNESGAYVLSGLHPGNYRVEVTAPGLSLDRRMDVAVVDNETGRLEHELSAAGVLQIAGRSLTYVGVAPRGHTEPVMLAIANRSVATFPGLAAGHYTVGRYHSDERVPVRPLADVEVVAGRTTWVDLREVGVDSVVKGRVLAGTEPVAGASVAIHPERTTTDAEGRYRVELGYRLDLERSAPIVFRIGGIEYQLKAPSRNTGHLTEIELEAQLGEHDLVVDAIDGNGRPTDGRVTVWSTGREDPRVSSTLSLAAGAVRFWPLPEATYGVRMTFDSGLAMTRMIDVPGNTPVVFHEPPAATLRVTLKKNGAPLAGGALSVATWSGDGDAPRDDDPFWHGADAIRSRTDAKGTAILVVPAGESVVAAHDWFSSNRERVTLRAGETRDVVLELPK